MILTGRERRRVVRNRRCNLTDIPIRRGDIWLCDLSDSLGSEQAGTRPVVILQNDKGNDVSPLTTVIPLTSRKKHYIPTHVPLPKEADVAVDSLAMAEQIRCVDRCRLLRRLGSVGNENIMLVIANAVRQNLEL